MQKENPHLGPTHNGRPVPSADNSIEEVGEDVLTIILGSEEEDQRPEPALPAEARDRDRSRSPRRPLAPPGPRLTTPRQLRPILVSRGIGGAASSPGGHSRSEDRMRPFSSAAAGAGRRSTGFHKDLHQVAIGPGERGIFHKPKHGAGPGGARPPHLTSTPGRAASGRAVPITSAHQSGAESVVSLVVFEEKDEAETELSRRGLKRTTTR